MVKTDENHLGGRHAPSPRQARSRVAFRFDAAIDDVPTDAALAVTSVARTLLDHAAQHSGSSASMRVARLGPLLNLWLTDPECSPSCLGRSGHVPTTSGHESTASGVLQLVLDAEPAGGLRLHWVLALADHPLMIPLVPSQRPAAESSVNGRTHRTTNA